MKFVSSLQYMRIHTQHRNLPALKSKNTKINKKKLISMYFSSQNHFIFVHSNSTRLWFVFCHIDSRDRCLELVYWWKRNLFIVTCCLFQVTTSIKNLLFLIFRKKIANNSFYYYFFSLNTLSLPITLRSTWWRKKNNTKNPVCHSANKCKCYFFVVVALFQWIA